MLNDRMRAAYDLIAPAYAKGTAGPMPAARAVVAADFARRLRASGGRLLDLGCGPGYDLAWFAQQGVRAVGADLSTAMLEHAGRAGPPLVQADMRHPPFADRAFAAVWCCASLLHVPKADLPATLAEIHRLLAPAGRLLVVLQEGQEEGWETGQWVEGVERFYSRYTLDAFRIALEAASFRVLDTLREPTDRRVWLRFVAERGVAARPSGSIPAMVRSMRFTTADLESMPDDGKRYEIIDGDLYVSRQPELDHQHVCGNVYTILRRWNDPANVGQVVFAPGLIFADDDNVAPDVIWITGERLAAALWEDRRHLHAAPELVVEVLSPGPANEHRDREAKLKLYSRRGVGEYWVVDGRQRSVELHRREDAELRLIATLYESDTLRSPLLPDFACPVAELFAGLP